MLFRVSHVKLKPIQTVRNIYYIVKYIQVHSLQNGLIAMLGIRNFIFSDKCRAIYILTDTDTANVLILSNAINL